MMKIGLISDVHADPLNLTKALILLSAQGCHEVLCAGDLVEKGPDGDEVVRILRENAIPTVAGNHDLAAPSNQTWLLENVGTDSPMLLEEETLAWLADLPPTLLFGWKDSRILVAHGTPKNAWTYLHHYSPEFVFDSEIAGAAADIIIVGHTHTPMQIRYHDRWVLNPGSVCGRLFDSGSQTCATLTLPDCTFTVFDLNSGEPASYVTREID